LPTAKTTAVAAPHDNRYNLGGGGKLMKICIDYEKCTGMGMCESIADDVFEVGEDASVNLLEEEVDEDRRDEMDEAVDSCPTGAISIQD
jgi:ferredoxin